MRRGKLLNRLDGGREVIFVFLDGDWARDLRIDRRDGFSPKGLCVLLQSR